MLLKGCELIQGQNTEIFRKHQRPDLIPLSFSLGFGQGTKVKRKKTLDLVCKDQKEVRKTRAVDNASLGANAIQFLLPPRLFHQYDIWIKGLSYLVSGPPPAELLLGRINGTAALDQGGVETAEGGARNLGKALRIRLKGDAAAMNHGTFPLTLTWFAYLSAFPCLFRRHQ